MSDKYDVVIVGGGPAGLFAAHRLIGKKRKVLIVDKGKAISERRCQLVTQGRCADCRFCDMMYGIGGSGLFSDGKLNLDPAVGGNLLEFVEEKTAEGLIDEVDSVFRKNGMKPGNSDGSSGKEKELLSARAARAGIRFVPIRQRHIGSDMLPAIMGRFMKSLERCGVDFLLNSEVAEIVVEGGRVKGVVINGGTGIEAGSALVAPGRGGERWLQKQAGKLGLQTIFNPIDVGVRVEVPSVVMDEVVKINWDPKFHIHTKTHDDFVRTFCCCPYGYVIKESYDNGFSCVNGHSMLNKRSQNTNFAFLVNVRLTEPVEDVISYGESIARLATTIGGGRPLIQRLSDLRMGRRSTWARIDRGFTAPTLRDATPGDISMALPKRVVTDITEGLDALDRVIPGVASDSTLLYAPEIKFHSMRIRTSKSLETGISGLFVAGDGAGVSRGIVIAAATGMIAADGIIHKT